jgi:hypothetical protein
MHYVLDCCMTNSTSLLKFGIGNAKLGKQIYTFTLPSGYTCPGASECLTRADRVTGRITDGKAQTFRCFAASMEARLTSLRAKGWHNLELLKGQNESQMTDLIQASIPAGATVIRIHVGGDYFNESYFRAWINVACNNPGIKFYSYTKSLPFWIAALQRNLIPENFRLTASEGGKYDAMIVRYNLKTSKVVFSIEEAAALGLEIDHDDSHAYDGTNSFALLIHGTQAAGSRASSAMRSLNGVGSYSRKSNKHSV